MSRRNRPTQGQLIPKQAANPVAIAMVEQDIAAPRAPKKPGWLCSALPPAPARCHDLSFRIQRMLHTTSLRARGVARPCTRMLAPGYRPSSAPSRQGVRHEESAARRHAPVYRCPAPRCRHCRPPAWSSRPVCIRHPPPWTDWNPYSRKTIPWWPCVGAMARGTRTRKSTRARSNS